jgi:hypothetical protein
MTIIYSTHKNKCYKDVRKKEILYTVGGNVISSTAMESNTEVPNKTKNRTTIQASQTTPGDLPKGK